MTQVDKKMNKSQTKKYKELVEIDSKLKSYPNLHLDEIYKRIHLDLFLAVNTGVIHTADPIFIREFQKMEQTMLRIQTELKRRTKNKFYIKTFWEQTPLDSSNGITDIPEFNKAFFKMLKPILNGIKSKSEN